MASWAVVFGLVSITAATSAWAGPASGASAAPDARLADAGRPAPAQTGSAIVGDVDAAGSAARSEDVTVYVTANPVHSDIILPRSAFDNAPPLVKAAVDRTGPGNWILIGWGPYWFGREVPGGPYHHQPWLAVNAIFTTVVPQTSTRLRVVAVEKPGAAPTEISTSMVAVRMTPDGLARAVRRINASFVADPDGGPILTTRAGAGPGASIYKSGEIYHVTHECNHWVAQVLRAGGVRDLAVLDLLPQSLDLDLKMSGATSVRPYANPKPGPAEASTLSEARQ